MRGECSVHRQDRGIFVEGVLGGDGFRLVLSAMHETVHKRGYQDLVLDFSKCKAAFPVGMLPICAASLDLREQGVDTSIVLPDDERVARLFVNANWAGLLDTNLPLDQFRGYIQIPATRYTDLAEQKEVVDRVMNSVLKSGSDFERSDFAAVEWALAELTDNVVNHSESRVGGLIQFHRRHTSKRIDVVICDAGLGIPATLMPAYPQIPSQFEALGWAIREGVTRDPNVGQGNGLFGSAEIARRSGGFFRLHSDHASLFLNEEEGLHLRNERIPVRGTVVDICVSYAVPNVLASALKFQDFVNDPTDHIFFRYQADSEDGTLRYEIAKEAESVRSRPAGKPVRQQLANLVKLTKEPIQIDFGQVPVVSSSFADEAIAKLILDITPDVFRRRIRFVGVTTEVKGILAKAVAQRTSREIDI